MITINGLNFASCKREFVYNVSSKENMCSGYYKLSNRGLLLYNSDNVLFAAVINAHNGAGCMFVSCELAGQVLNQARSK